MNESNVVEFKTPETQVDLLTEVIRAGAHKLLAKAVEAEVEDFLASYQQRLPDGKKQLVRNGYLPERSIQTGIGEVKVTVPRVRDRGTIKSEIYRVS